MNVGNPKRGVSNSIASPGVSILFGGMPSYKNATSHMHNLIPASFEPPSHRCLHEKPAYISKAEAIPSQKHTSSQQISPQKSLQKPVEKPRNPPPTSEAQSKPSPKPEPLQASAPKPTPLQPKTPTHAPSQPTHGLARPSTQSHSRSIQNFFHPPPSSSQKPALAFADLQRAFLHQKSAAAPVPDVPPTELEARLIYRQNAKNVPTPEDIAETVQTDLQRSKAELSTLVHQQQRELDRELAAQVQQHELRRSLDKETRNLYPESGFDFEFYHRYPKMRAAAVEAHKFLKRQKAEDAKRRDQQQKQLTQKPESMLSNEEYAELIKTSKQELLESKHKMEEELRHNYEETTKTARKQADLQRQQQYHEDNERVREVKRMIERENLEKAKRQQKMKQDMDLAMGFVNKQKQDQWYQKTHDTSNKAMSMQILAERQRLKAELENEKAKHRDEYKQELAKLQQYHRKQHAIESK
jgi:hypothetical protein